MRPATVSTLALLLVATAAIPVGSTTLAPAQQSSPQFDEPSPVIAPVENFANYAAIPAENVTRTAYGGSTVDVGTAIAADAARLRSDYRTTAFEDQFYGTRSTEERNEIVTKNIRLAEERTQELRDRREDAIGDYAADRTSTSSFVRTMALVDAEAERIATTVRRIKEVARTSSYSLPRSLDTRLENLRGELEVLHGPVAQRATDAIEGDGSIGSIYVESSNSGYTLAMIDGDSYHRETYLADERKPDAADQFRESDLYLVNAANRRGVELYPWVTNDTSPSGQALGETGIYRFRAEYTSGDLTAYLDGGTTNVFREYQRQSVNAVPVTNTVTERNETLRVRMDVTYETGPMNVTLVRNETGEPVDGEVWVDGTYIGSTGDDGTLWLVEPRPGVPLTVRTDSGGVVNVRVPP